ncbi:MAG: hypothetical protein OXK80_04235 [Bdellovibrionales bacterium]|nr:hypothetical protein [Bdellovibrionales bacterium]
MSFLMNMDKLRNTFYKAVQMSDAVKESALLQIRTRHLRKSNWIPAFAGMTYMQK